MGARDKASNKIDDLGGKAKGLSARRPEIRQREQNKGKVDQAKSSLKDAGEKIKDAFKNSAPIGSYSAPSSCLGRRAELRAKPERPCEVAADDSD